MPVKVLTFPASYCTSLHCISCFRCISPTHITTGLVFPQRKVPNMSGAIMNKDDENHLIRSASEERESVS